jgi:hypothetical protein
MVQEGAPVWALAQSLARTVQPPVPTETIATLEVESPTSSKGGWRTVIDWPLIARRLLPDGVNAMLWQRVLKAIRSAFDDDEPIVLDDIARMCVARMLMRVSEVGERQVVDGRRPLWTPLCAPLAGRCSRDSRVAEAFCAAGYIDEPQVRRARRQPGRE